MSQTNNPDKSSVASHSCTSGNSIEQLIKKWSEKVKTMKENRANEWDKAPDGEVWLLDQMIRNACDFVWDLRSLLNKDQSV